MSSAPHIFTVSPDFTPDHLSGWFIFNTWLQRVLSAHFHLELYDDFQSQREAIQRDQVDLIYANPYDAAMLVREKKFRPLARFAEKSDEALIAVRADSPYHTIEDLPPGIRLATTDDPDVHMMGMIMLEPADLNAANIETVQCDSYVLVAKELIKQTSQAGIFLSEAFNDLSKVIRKELRVLVNSQIQVVHHSLMSGPRIAQHHEPLLRELLAMQDCEKGRGVLQALGCAGWQVVDDEEMEFMIDLMDTLMI
jgi:phosphonate transport system substrate-binding protein